MSEATLHLHYQRYEPYVIYIAQTGSQAYGLAREGSDVDRRGIYLPPADAHWSLQGVPEQIEDKADEKCYWEMEKCLRLALKSNPNVLEVLHSPIVEKATPLAEELLAERGRFLSTQLYGTFCGYAESQFRKIEQDLRSQGKIKWKHAMHLIRILDLGVQTLRSGEMNVQVRDDLRALLWAIRDEQRSWDQVAELRAQLHLFI